MGWAGERTGSADGLTWLRARHYSPGLGRFVQCDTFAGNPGAPQSLNRYAGLEGNPVNHTDPSGRDMRYELVLNDGKATSGFGVNIRGNKQQCYSLYVYPEDRSLQLFGVRVVWARQPKYNPDTGWFTDRGAALEMRFQTPEQGKITGNALSLSQRPAAANFEGTKLITDPAALTYRLFNLTPAQRGGSGRPLPKRRKAGVATPDVERGVYFANTPEYGGRARKEVAIPLSCKDPNIQQWLATAQQIHRRSYLGQDPTEAPAFVDLRRMASQLSVRWNQANRPTTPDLWPERPNNCTTCSVAPFAIPMKPQFQVPRLR